MLAFFIQFHENGARVKKSRHTGENRCPVFFYNALKSLDSGFHRDDDSWTFYDSIKNGAAELRC